MRRWRFPRPTSPNSGLPITSGGSPPRQADAYEYALNTDPPVERPGNDPAVITDGQILAAVQAIAAEEEQGTP